MKDVINCCCFVLARRSPTLHHMLRAQCGLYVDFGLCPAGGRRAGAAEQDATVFARQQNQGTLHDTLPYVAKAVAHCTLSWVPFVNLRDAGTIDLAYHSLNKRR